MKKEMVYNMIDKNIIDFLKKNMLPSDIITQLELRANNMYKAIERDGLDASPLLDVLIGKIDIEQANVVNRVKYIYLYINHSQKRMLDMNWIMNKKNDLIRYSSLEIFNMLKFKEKLLSDSKKNV